METQYPSLSKRLQSTFIDILLIITLMYSMSVLLENIKEVPDWFIMLSFAGIWLLYEPLCTSLGCTLGQWITGIRVRQFKDHTKRIPFPLSIVRYISKSLLGWLSFLTIGRNPQKRAIHDMAAGSIVQYR